MGTGKASGEDPGKDPEEQIEVGSLLADQGDPLAYPCALSIPQGEGRWRARAPDLEGCVSEGDGPRECVANIVDAVVAWIETAESRGDPLPNPSAVERLARLPEYRDTLWTVAVRPRKGADLAISKELAEAGALPTLPVIPAIDLPRDTPPTIQQPGTALPGDAAGREGAPGAS